MLPLLLQNELMMTPDEKEREDGQKFWDKIWKPISKGADQLRSTFIRKVANETGMSKKTVRKLLGQVDVRCLV